MNQEVKRKCPKCGNNNINVKKSKPTFDGTIVDCTCNECKYEWNYVEDL